MPSRIVVVLVSCCRPCRADDALVAAVAADRERARAGEALPCAFGRVDGVGKKVRARGEQVAVVHCMAISTPSWCLRRCRLPKSIRSVVDRVGLGGIEVLDVVAQAVLVA